MPAASAEKRARQRANKLLRTEAEATSLTTPSNVLPSTQPSEIISESLSTPTPTSFTISYTPVSIYYPEPVNPASPLPTDVIRVTRDQLADMLHQSYVHGSEHGWKSHFASANELLRAGYEQDMQAATVKFAEHAKVEREEAFDRGFEYGCNDCEAQLNSLQESLTAEYDNQHLVTVANIDKLCQESREAGIREELERSKSARASQPNVTTQTDPITTTSISVQTDHLIAFTPTMTTASIQTNLLIIPPSSASISTQTEPILPSEIFSVSSPVPISKSPIPAIIDSASFDWGNDTLSLSTLPMIPLKQPRDLSCLHSSSKNPFSSLRRRHHRYPKRPQIFSSHRYTQFRPTHPPLRHPPLPLD
jgi:hypothetical protein